MALVDGEPVTRDDLGYALQVAHRREDLSTAKKFDISQYIQKLIDDRLITQEARSMGLEGSPEIREKITEFVLRESVVRLYNEEIVDKVSVTAEEVDNYYKENYESFTLNVIEASDGDKAGEILQRLGSGEEFEKLALEYSSHAEKQDVKELVVKRKSLRPAMQEAVSGLKPGQISNVIKDQDKYYIIKLLGREAAPDEELEAARKSIEGVLKDQKIKKRSDEYLAQLREKADIKIDIELLDSMQLETGDKTREEWLKDNRPLVRAKDLVLTAGDFAAALPDKVVISKVEILNNWVDYKLVDQEALSRHYDDNTDLKDAAQRYKNELLKSAFTRKVIIPEIKISEKDAEDYYQRHREEYAKPGHYKIQQITLKSQEAAQEAINSLKGGANFSWLARTKSTDPSASSGGVSQWKTRDQLPAPVQEIINDLKPGDLSQILQMGDEYLIVRLMEKSEKEFEEFSNIKSTVYNAAQREKFREIYDAYIEKLRKDARIELNEEAIRSFEETFKK